MERDLQNIVDLSAMLRSSLPQLRIVYPKSNLCLGYVQISNSRLVAEG